ncbi:EAL domain-containing protein [Altererythrobacter lutimaris]|uniref:EAL domain-containing protein n=1 Tax=Altererythrobacter lutimaris TaxID=2743979 RepID=A0A850H8S3_9SPHN|nr:EAL domain-containing protein [Altererythrobacter lutimaris]NVE93625.1 EAL domain-containing protein [Altererythrobacter lutimaris]
MKSQTPLSPTMRPSGIHPALEKALSRDVARAMEAGQIELRFQPQFCAKSGAMLGAEALARWQHPVLGEIGAAELFSMAARCNLSGELSQHMVSLAVAAASEWPQELRLSVNITPDQLADPAFASELTLLLVSHGFAPSRLTLEITEQTLLGNLTASARALTAVAATGVRIALDDFGAGFCNFQYLKRLPVHAIKLDRSMMHGITRSQRDLEVLRAILRLAEALELETVAEGIETEGQRQVVIDEGCDAWQGYLWAEPLGVHQMYTLSKV